MGTQRSGSMVQNIADSINFDRMKAFMLASQKVYYCAEKLPSNCDHNVSLQGLFVQHQVDTSKDNTSLIIIIHKQNIVSRNIHELRCQITSTYLS